MKKLLIASISTLILLPTLAFATPTSWDFTGTILRPLQSMWGNEVKVPYITATSTATSTLPNLTTTNTQVTGKLYDSSSPGLNGYVLKSTGTGISWVATSTLGFPTGTVTSVDMSVPTGFSISGNPIINSGTLALAYSAGYGGFLTASGTNWNTFYNTPSNRITAGNNLSWNGNTLNSLGFVGTTSNGVAGNLPYWTGASTLGTIATTSLTASGALSLSQPISVIGGSASVLTCATASGSTDGCLSQANWTTFNNKAPTASPIFTGLVTEANEYVSGTSSIGTTTGAYFSGQPSMLTIDSNSGTSEEPFVIRGSVNDFYEGNIVNMNTGTGTQSCWTATNNGGSLTSGFIAMCSNGTAFNNPRAWNIGGAGDTSIMSLSTGDLIFNNATATKAIRFVTGNSSSTTNTRLTIDGNGLIGIGSTTPSRLLTVAGDGYFLNAITAASSTITSATTTNFFTTNASSTNFWGSGLVDCATAATSKVLWTAATGKFSCGTDQTSAGAAANWLKNAGLDGISPTSTVGIVVTASSSISGLSVINSTTTNATTTVSNVTTLLKIPNSASLSASSTGQIGLDTTDDQFTFFGASAKKVLGDGNYYAAFTYATTTAWTGTTTIPLGTAFKAETWNAVQCYTDAGTLITQFSPDNTNWTNANFSSTTVGTTALTSNNTFSAASKRYVRIGTPASSPTTISCTVSRSLTST